MGDLRSNKEGIEKAVLGVELVIKESKKTIPFLSEECLNPVLVFFQIFIYGIEFLCLTCFCGKYLVRYIID